MLSGLALPKEYDYFSHILCGDKNMKLVRQVSTCCCSQYSCYSFHQYFDIILVPREIFARPDNWQESSFCFSVCLHPVCCYVPFKKYLKVI